MKKIYVLSHGSYSEYCLPTGKYQKFDIKFIDNSDFRFYSFRFFLKFQLGFLLKLKIIKNIVYSFFTIFLFGFYFRNEVKILIFEHNLTLRLPDYLVWLKFKLPNVKLIYFFTNRIGFISKISDEVIARISFFDEVITFSKEDALKYKIKYVKIPLYINDINLRKKCESDYLIYFIGRDKTDRFDDLSKISQVLQKLEIKYKFVLLSVFNRQKINVFKKEKIKKLLKIDLIYKPIGYKKILHDANCSQIILDLYDEKFKNTRDYSLRIVEALTLGKKIISNNHSLAQESFYSSSNILVFKDFKDLKSKLPSFLDKKALKYSLDDYKNYHFSKLLHVIDNVS